MALSDFAIEVLTRALPEDKIKSRPGGGGMKFNYITPDFVIETLNEAFGFDWSTKIVFSERYEDTVVVGLELSVPDPTGKVVVKQQFGSCDITKGLGVGEAFKGAASDAMKKCATLLGLGLELYQDEPSSGPASFVPPTSKKPVVPPAPAPRQAGQNFTPPKPTAAPATPPKPVAPPAPARPAPAPGVAPAMAPRSAPAAPPKPQRNPFANTKAENAGPNTTQLNSMINIALKKNMAHSELIALANVRDAFDQPVQSFEELTYNQAISVIQAAQRV
jgi:hypothetical protein